MWNDSLWVILHSFGFEMARLLDSCYCSHKLGCADTVGTTATARADRRLLLLISHRTDLEMRALQASLQLILNSLWNVGTTILILLLRNLRD